MKSVLLVCRRFPPVRGSGTIRNEAFCRHLPSLGWRPYVMTAQTEGIPGDGVIPPAQCLEIPWESARSRLSGWGSRCAGLSAVAVRIVRRKLVRLALARVEEYQGKIDVVLASCPTGDALVVGRAIANQLNVPFICDYRDPWSFSPRPLYPHWLDFFFEQQVERDILQSAAAVIATTKGIGNLLQTHLGADPRKVYIIRNGYNEEEFQPSPKLPKNMSVNDGLFHIVHTGELGGGEPPDFWGGVRKKIGFHYDPLSTDFTTRSPRFFLAGLLLAVRQRPELEQKIKVWFIGSDNLRNDSTIAGFPFPEMIEILPRVHAEEAAAAMRCASLLLLVQIATYLHCRDFSIQVAAKLYSYLRSGNRILAGVQPSENSELIQMFEAGRIVAPDDIDGFAIAIQDEFDHWRRNPSAQASSELRPLPEFTRRELTKQLASILDSVVAGSKD